MRTSGGSLQFSATDLVGFLNCQTLTALDRLVVEGRLSAPRADDAALDLLRERGERHERDYVAHLQAQGLSLQHIEGKGVSADAAAMTLDAMKKGVDVIVQGALAGGSWVGRADILRKTPRPSALGAWSYYPVDTKLARETKAGSVLQLCLYAELLTLVQDACPETMAILPPWRDFQPEVFRYSDFSAYFRHVKARFEAAMGQAQSGPPYPEPKAHCEVCRWSERCEKIWRADDHLSFVAGATKSQIAELETQGVRRLAELAVLPTPLTFKPSRGAIASYERIREQGRLQLRTRTTATPCFETLPVEPEVGLCRLPDPDPGDMFLDFEGDPFAGEHGLEYLTGYVCQNGEGVWEYNALWALNRAEERDAFVRFIDFVTARWEQRPRLHIYHFAPYEPSAIKRLMGRYAMREDQVDRMLRAELFVDLYAVVRKALRAGVESYSIKKLEALFGFQRKSPLKESGDARAALERVLELEEGRGLSEEIKDIVQAYNADDCFSTLALRDWLEGLRSAEIAKGAVIARPAAQDAGPSDAVSERAARVEALVERLTARLPPDEAEWTDEHRGLYLLASALDFHRREKKSTWWEYFRLAGLDAEDLIDERAGLSGLRFLQKVGGTDKAPIHRYSFPAQETELRGREELQSVGGDPFGAVVAVSLDDRTIDIKKRMDTRDHHPEAVFGFKDVKAGVLADALFRFGDHVLAHGLTGQGPFQAGRELLLRLAPRAKGGKTLLPETGDPVDAAKRICRDMAGGVLAIQGPPGAGKTYAGAQMICRLVEDGKSVGVTAHSHKVIRNLLDEVVKAAASLKLDLQCAQKIKDEEDDAPGLSFLYDNEDLDAALQDEADVGGATAWFWSREDAENLVDVLIVDEAAQMTLVNVLAVSAAAKTLVLLGDPQQLNQPIQGSHPEGSDVSALGHVLAGEATIAPERGLLLNKTWRLHPDICTFTSDVFYEGKLFPRDENQRQVILSNGPIKGSGLRYLPVIHQGNQNSSPEEADAIKALIELTLNSKPEWIDVRGIARPLKLEDILVITPYNAQVFAIQQAMPGVRVGTVDKFQGQEAPIAIYSTATSTHADAPRGMEFLVQS